MGLKSSQQLFITHQSRVEARDVLLSEILDVYDPDELDRELDLLVEASEELHQFRVADESERGTVALLRSLRTQRAIRIRVQALVSQELIGRQYHGSDKHVAVHEIGKYGAHPLLDLGFRVQQLVHLLTGVQVELGELSEEVEGGLDHLALPGLDLKEGEGDVPQKTSPHEEDLILGALRPSKIGLDRTTEPESAGNQYEALDLVANTALAKSTT